MDNNNILCECLKNRHFVAIYLKTHLVFDVVWFGLVSFRNL